jgi:ADP-ribosyl-[dinitrogen reductase] hydrolase
MPPRKPVPAVTDEQVRDRARGALLGLAVGESLGQATQGRALLAPAFPELADTPARELPAAPQLGPLALSAVALGHALAASGGYAADVAVTHHRQWLERAPAAPEVARDALSNPHLRNFPYQAAHAAWIRTQKRPPDGLPLARCVPLAVRYAREEAARSRAIQEDARLTHTDPRAVLAALALGAALAAAVRTAAENASALFAAAQSELSRGAALLGAVNGELIPEAQQAVRQLREDLSLAERPDPQLYGPELHLHRSGPSARLAFRLAFWEAAHAGTLEQGLLDVANRGGESGLNGAVAGALLGALHGEQALPPHWRLAARLARGPAAAGSGAPAWDLPTLLRPYEG